MPPAVGIFAMVVAVVMGSPRSLRFDVWTYIVAMLLLIVLEPGGYAAAQQNNLVGRIHLRPRALYPRRLPGAVAVHEYGVVGVDRVGGSAGGCS
ncbi:MAG: hypothetical protein R2873_34600 [Caldilineaceae bacterium]